jgi:hypothetical protein
MAKTVNLVLTEDEAKFLFSALDRVEIQGIGAARALSSVAEKLSIASRFAGERVEPRLPLEQALLARITSVPRNGDKSEPPKEQP